MTSQSSTKTPTLRPTPAELTRYVALGELRASVTEQIDHIAASVHRLRGGPYTVAQTRLLEVVADELLRRAGYSHDQERAA